MTQDTNAQTPTCARCPNPSTGPCCSSHNVQLCHLDYRLTHFVEVCVPGCSQCAAENLPVKLSDLRRGGGVMTDIPTGLDARPTVRYTVHCSHCGNAAPGYEDETPCLWKAEHLTRLGNYHLEECDWRVNSDADPEFGGRMLVCPECWTVGWCETCDDEIHAWQPFVTEPTDQSKWHEGCGSPQVAEAVA